MKAGLAVAAPALAASSVFAQYPSRPITLVVGFAPGGGAFMKKELDTWGKVVKEAKIQVQ